ncbi:MAG: alpha/beta fold hydrolase [Halobacteriota archaeon]
MPFVRHDDAELYYEVDGEGAETVVFLGEIGFGAWAWGWQYAALAGPYRTIVFDTRGCGRSTAPAGSFTMADLVGDLVSVLRATDTASAHLVGVGLGGAIAIEAARETNRARTLSVIGTAARGVQMDLAALRAAPDDRAALRRSTETALSSAFLEDQPDVVDQIVAWRAEEDSTIDAWNRLQEAVSSFDAEPLYEVTTPSLVVHGRDDSIVPITAGRELAEELPRGTFEPIEGAGHLANVERSREVNDRLVGVLESYVDS